MNIGIDGNMWYCSSGMHLYEREAKFVFEPTLREAISAYNKEFNFQYVCPDHMVDFLDCSPWQYQQRNIKRREKLCKYIFNGDL